MTPLAAPSTSPTSTPQTGGPRASAADAGSNTPFAQALERRQAQRGGPADPQTPPRPDTGDALSASPDATTTPARTGPDSIEADAADAASMIDLQQPAAPVWPPAGLAALLGFATDAEAAAEASTLPGTSAGALAPASLPASAQLPPAITGDAAPEPAAIALPLVEVTPEAALPVPAEGMDAAPQSFALPAPVALREPAPMLATPLPTPDVGADDFEARFGAQLQWMADQKIGHARIRVTPHDLGPVEVRLHLDGDRIRAEFVSPQAETRQALEQGLPRLRELLGEQGFQLAHADVGAQSRGGARDEGPGARRSDDSPAMEQDMAAPSAAGIRRVAAGLLDAYA